MEDKAAKSADKKEQQAPRTLSKIRVTLTGRNHTHLEESMYYFFDYIFFHVYFNKQSADNLLNVLMQIQTSQKLRDQ